MIGSFYRLVFPIILIAGDFCNEAKEPVEYGAMQHRQKKEGERRERVDLPLVLQFTALQGLTAFPGE
jgi:hypothetical protein